MTPHDEAYLRALHDNVLRALFESEEDSIAELTTIDQRFEHLHGAMQGKRDAQLQIASAFADLGLMTFASAFSLLADGGEGAWAPDLMETIDGKERDELLAQLRAALPS